MRLDELVKTNYKQNSVKDYEENGEDPDVRYAEKQDDPSVGRYSQVKPDENDPHMVNKKSFDPIQDLEKRDGYFYYINKISESGIADGNPYFPRIYDVNIFKDSTGKATFDAKIEKLERGDSLSEEELLLVASHCFKDFDSAMQRKSAYGGTLERKIPTKKLLILKTISMLLYDSLRHQGYVKDPLLAEAMKFIDDLYRKNKHIDEDLHEDNFMFRRGRYGLQLVITDPFRNR